MKYDELCDCIQNKTFSLIDNYNIQAGATFKENIEECISKVDLDKDVGIKLKTNYSHKDIEKMNQETFNKSFKNISVEITDTWVEISPMLDLHEELNLLENESENDYNICSEIYGKIFVNNCYRVYLPPFKTELINGEIVFIKAILYIFKNGMMILRISVPIQNVDTSLLFENSLEGYIKSIIDIFDIGTNIIPEIDGLTNLKNAYFEFIISCSKKIKDIASISATVKNIILADFDGTIEDIKNIPHGIEEDLYRIVNAPTIKRHDKSFKDIDKEYLEKNSDTYDGIKYITSSMGKCISIMDKTIINYLIGNGKEENDDLYNNIINSMRINVEFAIIIILLKKINSAYTYLQKGIKKKSFYKIQKEYLLNDIFILEMQQSSYGTVREQISFFEEKMKYFTGKDDIFNKMKSIDTIINEERERRNLKFQNFLSIGSVLLTIIFALPAIYDTLTILKMCLIPDIDIPNVTINESSLCCWVLLIFFIILKIIMNKINEKN